MKINNFWKAVAILPFLAACGNQQSQIQNDIAVPVSVIDVKKGPIVQYINSTGTANASSSVVLATEMAGNYSLAINPKTGREFKLGDLVEKGTTIVKLDNPESVNNISFDTKKLNYEIAQLEYDKQKSLYEKGGVTLRDTKNAEVALANAKTSLEDAKIQMLKTEVKAPFRATIVDVPHITNGAKITAGTAVVTIMDYSKLLMEVNLPEKYLTTIQLGQEVNITNYTLPNDTLKATISQLSPVISTETRTFIGKMIIDNPNLKLRPGMFVKADIEIARKDSAIVIPKDVIVSGGRGKTVYIVDKGAAQRRTITTGLENEKSVEVIEGLKANTRLVVKGFETLRDNSKVKIVK
ncbi:MAG: efflux RND transporter periplasmic adaptor subunit [Marinilabiliales bacterium]|nr:efflux RND transporter periplasmic adaptor subunit [Marinilabiliales bacterium]